MARERSISVRSVEFDARVNVGLLSIAIIVICLSALCFKRFLARFYLNLGEVTFVKYVLSGDSGNDFVFLPENTNNISCYQNEGNLGRAHYYFKQAARWNPGEGNMYRALGEAFYIYGDFVRAHDMLSKAAHLDALNQVDELRLANVFHKLNKPDEALPLYRRLLPKLGKSMFTKVEKLIMINEGRKYIARRLDSHCSNEDVANFISFFLWVGLPEEAQYVLNRDSRCLDKVWRNFFQGLIWEIEGKNLLALSAFQNSQDIPAARLHMARIYAQMGDWLNSAEMYQTYVRLVPEDLAGWREVSFALSKAGADTEASEYQSEFEKRADELGFIAQALGVSRTDVSLGPDLIVDDGRLEAEPRDDGWSSALWIKRRDKDYREGLFFPGIDRHEALFGHPSFRIHGLWAANFPPDKYPSRGGFWGPPLSLKPMTPYVISFYYRTERLKDNEAGIFVGGNEQVFFPGLLPLPATGGKWRRVVLIGWNLRSEPSEIRPGLWSQGIGDIWFNEFSLREAKLVSQVPAYNQIFKMIIR